MNKNDIVTVSIEDFTREGEGVGRAEGCTLFVKDAVIGDVVRARITRPKKTYAYARIEEIIAPSPDRVPARCPEARRCGGCRMQELSYEKQLLFKRKLVRDALERIGGFSVREAGSLEECSSFEGGLAPDMESTSSSGGQEVLLLPVLGMKEPFRYRNKAQYPVERREGRSEAGFYAGRTHSLIPVRDCVLLNEVNSRILTAFLSYMDTYGVPAYDEASGRGTVRHLLIREGFSTGEILVCPVINGRSLPHKKALTRALTAIPGVCSISLNCNEKRGNAILGEETIPLLGNPWITDVLGGMTFRISPRSFYQVNPSQTEVLYAEALRAAGLTGEEVVYDLYCGIGTISLYLARGAKEVYGVEIVPDAVRDAGENAARNGIENVHFYVGAAEKLVSLGEFAPGVPCPRPDVVVLDPPRKGCDPSLIKAVRSFGPKRIVYVSCDPATLARDLKLFASSGEGESYHPVYVRPVDMFPHTGHVESCALLKRVSG